MHSKYDGCEGHNAGFDNNFNPECSECWDEVEIQKKEEEEENYENFLYSVDDYDGDY